jgi:predicted N-acyltransferase
MRVTLIDSIAQITADAWNAVAGIDHPFTRHEFLHALEHSGAATADSGWRPRHALVHRGSELIAVLPLYLKYHSYGEYVFDWAWADAYRRYGRRYYPKLLCAIPFTPATGPRLCVAAGEDIAAVAAAVIAALKRQLGDGAASSLQVLFPQPELRDALVALGLSLRHGAQYHWFNRNYASFDDFLATFASRKRKNLRRERERVREQGLTLQVLEGDQIGADAWDHFYRFYQLTYAKRSGHGGYLNREFFNAIGRDLPGQLVLTLAHWRDSIVGGALCFRDSKTLYGRYWGCAQEFEFLHFEACYYQGIDYCIRNNIERFDPGAQGEHKIQRGFTPVETWSCHWIEDAEFRAAIDHFLARERSEIADYIVAAGELLPFKKAPC